MVRLMAGLVVLLAAQPQESARLVVPAVVMEDQFEKVHDVRHHRGDVVVLIYGDRKSADANQRLGEQLHVHYHPQAKGQPPARARLAPVEQVPGAPAGTRSPDVLAVPVACIGKLPVLIKALIRGRFKGASPEMPIWLDFEDLMKAQFPFQAGVPNVVVLDTQGRYRYAAGGAPTAQGVERLIGVIDQLRREAVEKK